MSKLENAPAPSRVVFVGSALAVAIIGSMAWFGVYTFVNAYLVTTLGRSDVEWTRSTIWLLSGMFVGQLLSTEVASRIGRRRTVTLALLLASGCFIMLAVLRSILLINMVLGLMGLVLPSWSSSGCRSSPSPEGTGPAGLLRPTCSSAPP